MPSPHMHSAFSLMEVLIAVALLATVMALSMEALIAGQRYDQFSSLQDDLALESNRILNRVRLDLTASGWEFPTNPPSTYASLGATEDRTRRYYPFVQIQSPGTPDITTGLGNAADFGWSHRPPNMVRLDAATAGTPTDGSAVGRVSAGVPGDFSMTAADALTAAVSRGAATGSTTALDYWYQSFFARSQEILFLRATVSTWDDAADAYVSQDREPLLRFKGTRQQWSSAGYHDALQVLHASGWYATTAGAVVTWNPWPVPHAATASATANDTPYGVVMEAGYLKDPSLGSNSPLGVNWRMVNGDAYSFDTTATGIAAYARNLQVYGYCVVPSPLGFGRLVRTRRSNGYAASHPWGVDPGQKIASDGTDCMVVDSVLSDHVMRICFDTYRTLPSVASADINQVRVRLYMGARADSGVAITRLFDTTICMRVRNTQGDKSENSTESIRGVLGGDAVGLNR